MYINCWKIKIESNSVKQSNNTTVVVEDTKSQQKMVLIKRNENPIKL